MPLRYQRILDALEARGSVQVSELAGELGVSAVTIRNDLRTLERRQLLRRTRGGAQPRTTGGEGAFSDRMRFDAPAKRAIAAEAASRVADGDVIAIDTSTTTHYLAKLLLARKGLVVVTSSLPTALLFHNHSAANVVMPGGVIRKESSGLVGRMGAIHHRGRIMRAFVGAFGVSTTGGLMELSSEESDAKRTLLDASDSVIGMFASSKISGFGLYPFAEPGEIDELITDTGASETFVSEWSAVGVPVIRVPFDHPRHPGSEPVQQRTIPVRSTAEEYQ